MAKSEIIGGKFLYFGYGSNLLEKRILINNKSAVRKDIGKLKDYEVDFRTYSKTWNGAPATIIERPGKHVWGAIWEIDLENMADLDRQEAVPSGKYIPLTLPIETVNSGPLLCRIYKLNKFSQDFSLDEKVPVYNLPSHTYLKTIIKGAIESGLPQYYIEFLENFKHNNNIVELFESEFGL